MSKNQNEKMGVFNLRASDSRLVWVTGCPRSGTTACFNWLNESEMFEGFNEPRVFDAAAEFMKIAVSSRALQNRDEFFETRMRQVISDYLVLRNPAARGICLFKEPLGLRAAVRFSMIRSIYPAMKVVFMLRHPVDTVNSMRQKKWGGTQLAEQPREISLIHCLKIWKANAELVIQHKDENGFFLCRHESLVENPKSESEKIKIFLGVSDIPAFVPKKTSPMILSPEEIEIILRETRSERRHFGYAADARCFDGDVKKGVCAEA